MGFQTNQDNLAEWNAAVTAFNNFQLQDAMELFCEIAVTSKIHFNIGVCCLNLFNYENAEMAFTKAIEADPYFSVAFYHRGWVYTQLRQFSKALRDYIQAYQSLRKNSSINYSQLGLEFELKAADIVLNAGLCTVLLDDVAKAKFHFKKGLQLGDAEQKKTCEKALQLGAKAPFEIPFNYMPLSLIFVPQTDQLAGVNEINYLGASKVISEKTVDSQETEKSRKKVQSLKADELDPDLLSEDFIFDYIESPTTPPSFPPRVSSYATPMGIFSNKSASISGTKGLPPRNARDRSNTAPLNRMHSSSSIEKSPSNGTRLKARAYSLHEDRLISIIIHYVYKTRSIKVPLDMAFQDLYLQIQNYFDLSTDIKVNYEDQYGDHISIGDDEDFRLCVHIWRGMNRGEDLHLYIVD